ncbi:18691_t:CDS:2 [Funneliformis geosporum]|uniref:18691_t:CDS:1 n=1 Tax=Funneliformis geosporum TaxID=1117311 RepID=A0A9W4X3N0_9GLOM|nr:18691_t:CDS:2 [Funneliformis geosporum]
MAIFGYQNNFSSINVQNLQKFALFRYFLIPFAIFLTVVPTGILSLTQQYQQNQNVVTFTTIISSREELFQEKIGDTSGGIVLIPNLTLSGDFISAFLIVFTGLQILSAIHSVVFIDQWIFEILSGSWQKAYLFDSELIKEIQYEFSCKGYASVDDRSANMPYRFDECCSEMLKNRFGAQLFDVAKIVLLARFIQLIGVLIHAHIFNRVIIHDIMMMYAEECEDHFYDEKEQHCISNSSNYSEEDNNDGWISSPTTSLLLSKIYFGQMS